VIWSGNGDPDPPRALWDSSLLSVILFYCVLHLFPIFVLGFDLVFLEFECKSSDDFSGIGSCPVEFHMCKLRDRILFI
jgi:hypothetical protein